MKVLLTGATGFLGMEVLARLVDRGDEVVALVRASDQAAAQQRLDDTLDLVGARGSATALLGDLEQGFEAPDDIDAVLHCAASISFGLPIEEARAINVGGTRLVLDAARRAGARLVHVSTAYTEGEHRNTYEQSKAEAEAEVAASGVPYVIARPSIVVGEAATGWTPAFNVLYWPLRAFARGLLDPVPADPAGRCDIVPVDYVADGLLTLLDDPSIEGVVHLAQGAEAATVSDLVELTCANLGRPRPSMISPRDAQLSAGGEHADVYLPYFDVLETFDASRSHELLGPPPALPEYFDRLIAYAEAAKWGKRRLRRPDAALV